MVKRTLWCLVGMMALSAPGARADGAPAVGVLVVAHGGTNQWDGTVRKTVRDAGLAPPVEVVFGSFLEFFRNQGAYQVGYTVFNHPHMPPHLRRSVPA